MTVDEARLMCWLIVTVCSAVTVNAWLPPVEKGVSRTTLARVAVSVVAPFRVQPVPVRLKSPVEAVRALEMVIALVLTVRVLKVWALSAKVTAPLFWLAFAESTA